MIRMIPGSFVVRRQLAAVMAFVFVLVSTQFVAARFVAAQEEELVREIASVGANEVLDFAIDVEEDSVLTVRAVSVDFTPRIVVDMPHFSDPVETVGTQGSTVFSSLAPIGGEVLIEVSSDNNNAGGDLIVLARQRSTSGEIELGATLRGDIEEQDALFEGERRVDWFRYESDGDEWFEVVVDAPRDSYLYVLRPNGSIDWNDDYEGLNAGLLVAGSQEGVYYFGAALLSSTALGEYRLQLTDAERPQRISVGDTIQSSLTEDVTSERYYLQGEQGDTVVISMFERDNSGLDPRIDVVGPDGQRDSNDDALGLGLNSRLSYTFPIDGALQIEATSYLGNDTGAYELSIDENDEDAEDVSSSVGWPEEDARRITVGRRYEGTLSSDSYRFENRPFDPYVIELRQGQEVVVDMGAANDSGLDTLLRIEGPDGQTWRNDDGGEGYNSRIEFRASTRGDYRIRATSFSTRGAGDYFLEVQNMASADSASSGRTSAERADGQSAEVDTIVFNERGRLGSRSETDRDGRPVEAFDVDLEAGSYYQITAESDDFSPRVAVVRDGIERGSTRPGQGGRVSLTFFADAAGEYEILVRSEQPNGEGRFRLQVIETSDDR